MKIGKTLAALCVGTTAAMLGVMSADAVPGDKKSGDGTAGGIGADVAVCDLPGIYRWGTYQGRTGYSVATTSVNLGDVDLDWIENSHRHPRIPQNAYRFKDGRLQQIGMSWCKDGFCALQLDGCEEPGQSCNGPGGCPQYLTPGCGDPYGDSLNGSWGRLAPRSQCNPATGWYIFPPENLQAATNAPDRRMSILVDDLAPAQNSGATFYCEGIYLHEQDVDSGNDDNNASFRRMSVGSLSSSGYRLTPQGSTYKYQAGIYAWGVHSEDVEFVIQDIDNDGRVIIGMDAIDNGDGTYRYEYAIYNQNSDECVKSFTVPVPAGVNVTDAGFSDIHHHFGEPYSTNDWIISEDSGSVTWQTESFDSDENANAIRWGTMYNFWFTADAGPAEANGGLRTFKSDEPYDLALLAPAGPENPFDLNGDGCVDGGDLGIFLSYWGSDNPAADFDGSGQVDGGDAGLLLVNWGGDDCD